MNSIRTLLFCFFKLYFNIIISSTPRSSQWPLSDSIYTMLLVRWYEHVYVHISLFLVELIFLSWRWRRYVPPKRRFDTERTTRRYTPEDGTLHNHHCENIKSYVSNLVCVLLFYFLFFTRAHFTVGLWAVRFAHKKIRIELIGLLGNASYQILKSTYHLLRYNAV
jgi:hypothetical protein